MAAGADTTLAGGFPPATEDDWRASAERVLDGAPFDRLVSRTADGIAVQPLYTTGPDDRSTGQPGAAPFTRGFTAVQRPAGMWDVRARIDGADASQNNRIALRELERGASSLLLAGAALADEGAFLTAVDGVLLDMAPVILQSGSGFASTAEWLMRRWLDSGVPDDDARGGFGADPLGTLARTGLLPQGVERALGDAAGLAAMAASRYPGVRALSVDATPYAEAGASEALELAAMLSTGAAYFAAMEGAGLDAGAAGSQIEIVLGADPDYFTTIAKFRAARRVWSAMAEACGVDVSVAAPAMTVRTLDRCMSTRDPWVNLLRVTSACFAAVLGGADSVITLGFDAELGESGELGRRMARNTQLLLGEESGVGQVMDPAGGSWYVETLTEQLASEAWDNFRVFEGAGGLPSVLLDSTLGTRIADVRDTRLAAVADRSSPLTGVSEFPDIDEERPEVAPRVEGAAVEAPETGSATRCSPLEPVRWAEEFEQLRDDADSAVATGASPSVFLANLGAVSTHTARASWAKNFFEAGGIRAITSNVGATSGFEDPAELATDFAASGASIACLCSSDALYAKHGAAAAAALVGAGARRVYVAGNPRDARADLQDAGVEQFVHVGTDALSVLRAAHQVLGIGNSEDRR